MFSRVIVTYFLKWYFRVFYFKYSRNAELHKIYSYAFSVELQLIDIYIMLSMRSMAGRSGNTQRSSVLFCGSSKSDSRGLLSKTRLLLCVNFTEEVVRIQRIPRVVTEKVEKR